ncbi:4'-phosphopantetheinyl transferase family protein [Desulfovibrio sp. SGI.169]|uniref:4'-phosphopantetheinyl transferase family protein n=1 Tax=Desulfovibrio sp. SGI.169 TaxID=3420561 RepID=UPI003CFFC1D6
MSSHAHAKCYSLDIAALPPLPEIESEMPPERRKALHALARHDDRLRCAAGWLLMRAVLGSGTARVRYGRYGKPFLPGGPYFSLSHSGRYALLAEAPMPVGVDVEEIRQEKDCAALARQALHPDERKFFAGKPVPQTFFDIWTLKESYLKLRGTGLNENPATFALTFGKSNARLPGMPDVHFCLYHHLPGHSAAICLYRCMPPQAIVALRL